MNKENLYKNLFENVAGTTILTPNRRLSATLHKLYVRHQTELGNECWDTPDILPLTSWLQRLWQNYLAQYFESAPLLLTISQEQFLWENILTATKDNFELLQISETADLIKSAWGLLKQWQVDLNHSVFKTADDYVALQTWAEEFKQRCAKHNWLDNASLADYLHEQIKSAKITLPKNILLLGFTEISPQYQTLFVSCEALGVKINVTNLTQPANDCKQTSLVDTEAEIIAMARWAKAHSLQDKNATIGCIIPSLDKIRDRVQQIFSEVFADDHTFSVDINNCPFNLSAGKSLIYYPIIHTALLLLELYKGEISIEKLCYLLASPFIGEAESERMKRCLFDNTLRKENINHINLRTSIQKTVDVKQVALGNDCPQLAARIHHFLNETALYNTTKSYSEWAHIFNHLLSLLGWPGERSLTSYEYQIVDNWLKLLNEYGSLDQVAAPVHFLPALQLLSTMASKSPFQPKTPEAPIQVLGILEGAGLPFDYLWVAGMDDLSWPPQPKPNPFIPKRLQRELKMPHATAERELFFCEIITQQFKNSSAQSIFSHAEKNDDLELQASPLIRELPYVSATQLTLATYVPASERIFLTRRLEKMLDEAAPALSVTEKIRGGVNVIKLQALCPFKSFAESRLHARELEFPLPGLRAKDRGNIIHKILELIWNQLSNHYQLISIRDIELQELISSCIDQTFTAFPNSRSHYVQYISLEKKRLQGLIFDWLQIEKNRPDFTVLTSEKAVTIKLDQLTLSLRIDRIDELADGKKLIIDYKTGKYNDINTWFGIRPEEPQLPLYALIDPEGTTALSFAQVASGDSCFKGISRYDIDIDGIKAITDIKKNTAISWPEQISQWNIILTQLAHDFSQGIAKVDPKDAVQTCTWCALKSLCRINEEVEHHESH